MRWLTADWVMPWKLAALEKLRKAATSQKRRRLFMWESQLSIKGLYVKGSER